MGKPILCVDFDGVIHSYKTKWTNAWTVSDGPVPGAIKFLIDAQNFFDVQIYSSRSKSFWGRRAMKKALFRWFSEEADVKDSAAQRKTFETVSMDPWEYEVEFAGRIFIKKLKFPVKKPAAFMTIDDRAHCFMGTFPKPDELMSFKPWNKK